jgi:hypothetical protein
MNEGEKKYLFIFSDGKVEKYVTNRYNLLKEKETELSVPDIGIDSRLSKFVNAVYKKIHLHSSLGVNDVTLENNLSEYFRELAENDRIRISFKADGRPLEYVHFNKEDQETGFSWAQSTAEGYNALKYRIENTIDGSLNDFNIIFIAEDLFKQNYLFHSMKSEEWFSRVEKNKESFNDNLIKYRSDKIFTTEERERKIEEINKSQGESGNYEILQQKWKNINISHDEKIIACRQFLKEFPNSQYRIDIESKLLTFRYKRAEEENKISSYLDFLVDCNDAALKKSAKEGIINIENSINRTVIEPLKANIQTLSTKNELYRSDIDELRTKGEQYKRKSKMMLVGFLIFLILGSSAGYLFSKNVKNNAPEVKENPLTKRVNELIENRIYVKQQLLFKQNAGSSPEEMMGMLKEQESLNKALFDIHKVKFELLPQLTDNKISASEVEKEIIKIENQIK